MFYVSGRGGDAFAAGGCEGVAAAEEETVDRIGGGFAGFCIVEMAAVVGFGREVREEEVEVCFKGGFWFICEGICASMSIVNWFCLC